MKKSIVIAIVGVLVVAGVGSAVYFQATKEPKVGSVVASTEQEVAVPSADDMEAQVKEVVAAKEAELEAQKALSKEITAEMFTTLIKGQDAPVSTVTPEEIADAITGTIANVDGVNQEALDTFNQALVGLMQTMVVPNDKPDE